MMVLVDFTFKNIYYYSGLLRKMSGHRHSVEALNVILSFMIKTALSGVECLLHTLLLRRCGVMVIHSAEPVPLFHFVLVKITVS